MPLDGSELEPHPPPTPARVEDEVPVPVSHPLLTVIVPVFNECATILELLNRVIAVPLSKQVLVIDDGSSDGTQEVLRSAADGKLPDVEVAYHAVNRGKGAAIRTAIPLARGQFVLIQDADLEYDPREYSRLLEPLQDGRADVVYGSRFLGGGAHRVLLFWHRVGNAFLTLVSNMLTNLNLTDMEVCYKVFRRELIQGLILHSDRFDIEPEITAKVARAGCRIYEVPISYSGRNYADGKKIGWKDGFLALWTIVKYRFVD
ncbi:MAG: glycosyltransferase family 2 protein [Armatimonadetes bacterium]|nr:glycosyltransferase family 2 protein [Armatimonadota bacterium]MDE2205571.1 glycosyltransferase family 2 protein [Armatimonadota bacterium]